MGQKNLQFFSWRNLLVAVFIAVIGVTIFLVLQNILLNQKSPANPYQNAKIEIKVFQNDPEENFSGFGYEIYVSDTLFIHQPHIPGIPGTQGFQTEEDAQKVAELVVEKIRNNITPPSISTEELKGLGIIKEK